MLRESALLLYQGDRGVTGWQSIPAAVQAPPLAAFRWPGNLCQLHNVLATSVALLAGGEVQIDFQHLPEDLADDLRAARASRPAEALADAEDDLRLQEAHTVSRVVEVCRGNLSEAARRLGISRNTLYRKLGREPVAAGTGPSVQPARMARPATDWQVAP